MKRSKISARFFEVLAFVALILMISVGVTKRMSYATEKPEVFVQLGHSSYVFAVAFSPDGRYAMSGSGDNTLKLWDVSTGREVRTFRGHSNYVNSLAFSPDGRYALSGSGDQTIKLWEVATGREIRTFSGHSDYVRSVAFSPDGSNALSVSRDNTLKLWDIQTGRTKATKKNIGAITTVAFSPDGGRVLLGGGGWKAALCRGG